MSLVLDGSNGITYPATTNVQNAAICAWVNFNGVGGATINASFNVTSVTRNGTGDYTVNFTTAISDNKYAASCLTNIGNGQTRADNCSSMYSQNTTNASFKVGWPTDIRGDFSSVSVIVVR